jgi:hypothetical protein
MYAIAQSERVAFSKMSGVQQFANATALFVNIGGSQNYDNAFDKSTGDDAGMSITWFAQRRHKPTTAVIVRSECVSACARVMQCDVIARARSDEEGRDCVAVLSHNAAVAFALRLLRHTELRFSARVRLSLRCVSDVRRST